MAVLVDQVRTRALEVTPDSSSQGQGESSAIEHLVEGVGFQNPGGGPSNSCSGYLMSSLTSVGLAYRWCICIHSGKTPKRKN